MKKILLILISMMFLTSCFENKKIFTSYKKIYKYKVYDGVLGYVYFTNDIIYENNYIRFIDHDNDIIKCSEYTIIENKFIQ